MIRKMNRFEWREVSGIQSFTRKRVKEMGMVGGWQKRWVPMVAVSTLPCGARIHHMQQKVLNSIYSAENVGI